MTKSSTKNIAIVSSENVHSNHYPNSYSEAYMHSNLLVAELSEKR